MPPNEWVAARVLLKRLKDLNAGRERPVALFMPGWPKKKHPMIAHVTGAEPWTEETSAAWLAKNRSVRFSVGMLLYDLFVIDFDEHSIYELWLAEHPELGDAPAERTRKGFHVYFQRCPAVEAAGLFNGAMIDPVTEKPAKIDRKTLTGTGAGGFLVCAPTPNYEWMPGRSLFDRDPPVMSPELLRKVVAHSGKGKKRPASVAASKADAVAQERPTTTIIAPEAHFGKLLRLFGFPAERFLGKLAQQGVTPDRLVKFRQVESFLARSESACYMCGKVHKDRVSGKVVLVDGVTYRLNVAHFRPKDHPRCRRMHTISADATAAYVASFSKTPSLTGDEAAAVEDACRSAGVPLPSARRVLVWPVDEPAAGFAAHAVRAGEDDWFMLLRNGAGGSWWRHTLLPGLFYEFLNPGEWKAADGAAQKPPFWSPAPAEKEKRHALALKFCFAGPLSSPPLVVHPAPLLARPPCQDWRSTRYGRGAGRTNRIRAQR